MNLVILCNFMLTKGGLLSDIRADIVQNMVLLCSTIGALHGAVEHADSWSGFCSSSYDSCCSFC